MNVFDLLNQQFNTLGAKGNENISGGVLDLESVDSSNERVCPECGSDDLVTDEGTVVCRNCGSDQKIQIIDTRSDKVFYCNNDKGDPTTTGSNIDPLLPKFSMSTMIVGPGSKYYRQRHNWTIPYDERSLWKIFETIQSKCSQNDIPQCIIQKAKEYYKVLREKKITRGKIRWGVLAACVYTGCKNQNVPRSKKEISDIFGITEKMVTVGINEFNTLMADSLKSDDIRPTNYFDFLDRFCNKLYIDDNTQQIVKKVLRKAEKLNLVYDNTPPAILSGAIYFTCEILEIKFDKAKLANLCNISPVTMVKVANKLKEHEDKFFKINYILKQD